MRPDFDRIPLPSGGLSDAADRRTTGRNYAATDPTYPTVDQDRRPGSVTSVGAGIAVVDVTDDTTTNYRAENRAEYGANVATAAYATIVST